MRPKYRYSVPDAPGARLRRARGYEAETDPRDAQVLSRFGRVFQGNCTRRPEPELEELPDLLPRRRQLVEQKVQDSGRMDKAATPGVAKSTNRHVSWLEEEITKLDKECQEPLQNSAALNQRAALYRTVPGVGISTVAILLAHLPELGLPELGLPELGLPELGLPELGLWELGLWELGLWELGLWELGLWEPSASSITTASLKLCPRGRKTANRCVVIHTVNDYHCCHDESNASPAWSCPASRTVFGSCPP